jgi:hypothetical protein
MAPEFSKKQWVSEIYEFQRRFSSFASPASFIAALERLMERIPGEVFFNLPASSVLRDAYIVGRFASLAEADEVRLESTEWPDGQVRFGDLIVNIEATEALEPGRRRGAEFRRRGIVVEQDPVQNWHKRADALPGQLKNSIEKKKNKNYGSSSTLVVYIGFGFYGIRQTETEAAIKDCQMRFKERFEAVRVLWDGRLF